MNDNELAKELAKFKVKGVALHMTNSSQNFRHLPQVQGSRGPCSLPIGCLQSRGSGNHTQLL